MRKYLLGVHRKSTNDAVRAELGRFPLLITILNNAYRYLHRIQKSPLSSLVKASCADGEVISLDFTWNNCINKLISVFNQSRSFLDDMKNVYRISWSQSLNSCSGKLRTYSKFKNTFCLENYIIQFPLHIRRNLTKLRISSHNLAIETGRYVKNKNSPADKRHCFHCKTIESEFHSMIECTLHSTEREKHLMN